MGTTANPKALDAWGENWQWDHTLLGAAIPQKRSVALSNPGSHGQYSARPVEALTYPLDITLTWDAGEPTLVTAPTDPRLGKNPVTVGSKIQLDADEQTYKLFRVTNIAEGQGNWKITIDNREERTITSGTSQSSILLEGSLITLAKAEGAIHDGGFTLDPTGGIFVDGVRTVTHPALRLYNSDVASIYPLDLGTEWAWDGTTTVTADSIPSGMAAGSWIGVKGDGQYFEIDEIAGLTVTILNPDSLTIPDTTVGGYTTAWNRTVKELDPKNNGYDGAQDIEQMGGCVVVRPQAGGWVFDSRLPGYHNSVMDTDFPIELGGITWPSRVVGGDEVTATLSCADATPIAKLRTWRESSTGDDIYLDAIRLDAKWDEEDDESYTPILTNGGWYEVIGADATASPNPTITIAVPAGHVTPANGAGSTSIILRGRGRGLCPHVKFVNYEIFTDGQDSPFLDNVLNVLDRAIIDGADIVCIGDWEFANKEETGSYWLVIREMIRNAIDVLDAENIAVIGRGSLSLGVDLKREPNLKLGGTAISPKMWTASHVGPNNYNPEVSDINFFTPNPGGVTPTIYNSLAVAPTLYGWNLFFMGYFGIFSDHVGDVHSYPDFAVPGGSLMVGLPESCTTSPNQSYNSVIGLGHYADYSYAADALPSYLINELRARLGAFSPLANYDKYLPATTIPLTIAMEAYKRKYGTRPPRNKLRDFILKNCMSDIYPDTIPWTYRDDSKYWEGLDPSGHIIVPNDSIHPLYDVYWYTAFGNYFAYLDSRYATVGGGEDGKTVSFVFEPEFKWGRNMKACMGRGVPNLSDVINAIASA